MGQVVRELWDMGCWEDCCGFSSWEPESNTIVTGSELLHISFSLLSSAWFMSSSQGQATAGDSSVVMWSTDSDIKMLRKE